MRRYLKIILRVLAVLALLALAAGLWKREEIARLMAVNTLFDEGRIVANFSHMDRAFLTVPVPRGDGPVSPLPQAAPADLPPDVAAWIDARAITALVVLQNGAIVHESYHLGTMPEDRRISWSVAKSYLSALLGTLVADSTIPDLDAPVTHYVPLLSGSAYDGASIRNVAQMASGVAFDEDYLDYNSDINRMGREIALGGTLDGFTAGLTARARDPGSAWQYVSMDTHVIGMVIRGATGRDIPSLLSERLIVPLGLEAEPYYLTDGEGVAFVLGGLNLTTRDYARFGQMIAQDGVWQGTRILPEGWVTESTAPSAPTAPGAIGYGYQWWVPVGAGPGQFMARGIYGQYLYIDQPRGVVIATNGADRGFREPGVDDANIAMFRLIADSL
ncbi:serine hydrolase domain-containing protein [Roseicyclus mahoneyensis]|uniref:CubicO group peptidase (Beta-lactamase class C family) n=1 Tax=Roseicyclus mahoneyensis TaxID=164332 RepID=A0A316G9H9_9RHOB|nr:serine hydrolase [Roseicyclus mahoneyensis]PWK57282.1 CubicO group peptidase (beta-lactamase class C family) [Roseicyclus mahoneyensis]